MRTIKETPDLLDGLLTKIQKAHSEATMMTYLPPILTPITEYPTIIEMFYVSRQLAKQSNMTYTRITLDVGAAIKAFHVIWNNPVAWSDIVIHLGDFHAMMAYFGVIGLYVSGSGFEEVLLQADLCGSGSIRGVISGKHYNRCWKIHETFAEVLERLFLEKFMPDIPDDIKKLAASHLEVSAVSRVINESGVADYYQRYQTQFRKCLNGEFGKTAQYWATYMKMVDHLQYRQEITWHCVCPRLARVRPASCVYSARVWPAKRPRSARILPASASKPPAGTRILRPAS